VQAEGGADRRGVEAWFVRRGLPHLIEGYNAREDILTRAVPLLAVVIVVEVLLGLDVDFVWWANLAALAGAVAIALGGLAAVNRMRGRRPFQRPDTIGTPEVLAFVLVPPLIPLVFGGQVAQALQVAAANLVVLGLIYVGTSYAVVPMTRWAGQQALRQVGAIANLMVRSLPLLLLFSMFLFFNAELWKIMDDLPDAAWWAAIGLLVLVGSSFIAFRVPRELADVSRFGSWREVGEVLDADPSVPMGSTLLAGLDLDERPAPPPLGRRARANLGLVFFAGQSMQILAVTVLIGTFYVAFGMLTIIESTIVQWTSSEDVRVLWRVAVGDADLVLTVELLRTAAFIATVSGLQFTVSALTDTAYRGEFLAGAVAELREALATRAAYLACLVPGAVTRTGPPS
jgi:hypothetical protein